MTPERLTNEQLTKMEGMLSVRKLLPVRSEQDQLFLELFDLIDSLVAEVRQLRKEKEATP